MELSDAEKQIIMGVKEFIRDHKAKYFSLADVYNDKRFSHIKTDTMDKISIIRESIDNYESIGVVDRVGHDFYSNG